MAVKLIPPYPGHLTPAERQAVAEKAARDLAADYPANAQPTGAALAGLMGLVADLMVQAVWLSQRVAALEAAAQAEDAE